MNTLSVLRLFCEFTIYLWIYYLLNPRSFWQNHYWFGDSLSIHGLLRDFTMNSLSLSRIYLELTILFPKSLEIHHICFAISQWIDYIFREFTLICFANFLWIHNLFCDFTMNLLSFSRNHCKFTIYFENPLLIHYLFRDIPLNSLFVWLIHYTSKIILGDSAWINYSFRESTLNSLSISRTQFESALFIANLLRIMTHSRNHAVFFRNRQKYRRPWSNRNQRLRCHAL